MYTDPLYNTPLYQEAVRLSHQHQQKIWPAIQKLYSEPKPFRRKSLFLKTAQPNAELFKCLKEIIVGRHQHAIKNGYPSLLDEISDKDPDPFHWKKLFASPEYKTVIASYASAYALQRKQALGLKHFYPWDYWFQSVAESGQEPHLFCLAPSLEKSLQIMRQFFVKLGYQDLLSQVFWIKEQEQTLARLDIDDEGKLMASVSISAASVHAKMGSLTYLSTIAHEMGHVIQAMTNQRISRANLAPSHLMREIVSIFFQKLFLSESNLSVITPQGSFEALLEKVNFENQETLARLLCILEFEAGLYELEAQGRLELEAVGYLWKNLHASYFGFEDHLVGDHTWQKGAYYIAYYPFYNRSYVLGEILSQIMLEKFLRSINSSLDHPQTVSLLHPMIATCSDKGTQNTWDDIQKACNLPQLNDEIVLKEITRLLASRISQELPLAAAPVGK